MKLKDVEVSRFHNAYVCMKGTSFPLSDSCKRVCYGDCEVTKLHLIQKCVYIEIGGIEK